MCSIEGFTGKHSFTIQEFTAFNKDRGPDDTGYYEDENVSIGHNLLSIQDNPSGISQPFVDANGCVLAYNGEIYAHFNRELPEHVIDTEWMARQLRPMSMHNTMNHPAINTYGFRDFYDEVDGMWAFSYYNPEAKTILFCRDHFGVKPLYYMELEGELFWSSTVKPLLAVLNHYGEAEFTAGFGKKNVEADGWWVPPETHVKHIKSMMPGQYMTWSIVEKKFTRMAGCLWRESNFDLRPNYNYDPCEFEEILVTSMERIFKVGDHKKAISLSGGLDSSLLVGIAKDFPDIDLMTTSVAFEGETDENTHVSYIGESKKAKQTADWAKVEHHETVVKEDFEDRFWEAYSRIGQYVWLSSRLIPRLYNIENAHKHGAKIYYSGDLADEIVTGYGSHQNYFVENSRGGIQGYNIWGKALRDKFPSGVYDDFTRGFPDTCLKGDEVNNNLFLRLMQSTQSFCGVLDALCGSYGIESRVPYLYQRWAKYALRIPSATKLRIPYVRERNDDSVAGHAVRSEQKNSDGHWTMGNLRGTYKWLFREEMKDYLPDHVRTDIEKVGFSTPWNSRNQTLNNTIRKDEFHRCYPDLWKEYVFESDKKM